MRKVIRIGTKTPEEWFEHVMAATKAVPLNEVPAKTKGAFLPLDLYDRLGYRLGLLQPDEALRLPHPRAISNNLRSGLYKGAKRTGLKISMVARNEPTGSFLYVSVVRKVPIEPKKPHTLTCAICGKETPRYSQAQMVCSSNKGRNVFTKCQVRLRSTYDLARRGAR